MDYELPQPLHSAYKRIKTHSSFGHSLSLLPTTSSANSTLAVKKCSLNTKPGVTTPFYVLAPQLQRELLKTSIHSFFFLFFLSDCIVQDF